MRSRVVACRQRLRRTRAAQKTTAAGVGEGDAPGTSDLSKTAPGHLSEDALAAVLRKANADPSWPGRRS